MAMQAPAGVDSSVWGALDDQTRESLWWQLDPPPPGMELGAWARLDAALRSTMQRQLDGAASAATSCCSTSPAGASSAPAAKVSNDAVVDLTQSGDAAPVEAPQAAAAAAAAATEAASVGVAPTVPETVAAADGTMARKRKVETRNRIHALAKACLRDGHCCRQVAEQCCRSGAGNGASLFNELQRIASDVQARHDIARGGQISCTSISDFRSDGEKCQQLVLQFQAMVNEQEGDRHLRDLLDSTEPLVQDAMLITPPPSGQQCHEKIQRERAAFQAQVAASQRNKALVQPAKQPKIVVRTSKLAISKPKLGRRAIPRGRSRGRR